MIRAVFDTNILYSAIRQPQGLPAKAVDLVASGLVLPCVSEAVMEEYREVLLRPELDLNSGLRQRVLNLFEAVAIHVSPTVILKISDHEEDNRIY